MLEAKEDLRRLNLMCSSSQRRLHRGFYLVVRYLLRVLWENLIWDLLPISFEFSALASISAILFPRQFLYQK
jgi:hypothetical protein